MKLKQLLAAALVISSAAAVTVPAKADNEKFTVISIPSSFKYTDYISQSSALARYADDKTPIAISQYYDGKMFATVPAENADREIEEFIPESPEFTDKYSPEIASLARRGVIEGDEQGRARPNDTITRAEAAAMIMRTLGLGESNKGSGFNDVSPDDWFSGVVAAAKEYGIINGEPDGNFNPYRDVTHEEFTVMAARAGYTAGLCTEPQNPDRDIIGIDDADAISDWALSAYKLFGSFNIVDHQELSDYDIKIHARTALNYSEPQKAALRKEAAHLLDVLLKNYQHYPSSAAIEYGFDKEMPVIDGSTSTYPFTTAVYNSLFSNGYRHHPTMPESHSKSHASYERLINGEVDMLFAASYPALDILALAEEKGVELELIPIAYDAMIFFTNAGNSAEGLTSEQITNIYVNNAYENWNEIGGPNASLYPYCRNNDSGSHAQMERHFLNGNEINEKIRNETTSVGMANILTDVMRAQTDNPAGFGLGYSIYYYFNSMDYIYNTKTNLKLLSIDGVYPTDETIADGSYPLANNTYIVMLKSQPEGSPARKMAEFMLTERGQGCVESAGYGPLKYENK